jgi:hypothetical protein
MRHTNLALLDRAVKGAVALEMGEGDNDTAALAELGITPQRTRTVAGLTVISNASRDAKVNPNAAAMLKKLKTYLTDSAAVQNKLEKVGVTPHAVLPLVAWERICDSAKLYRFVPKGDAVRFASKDNALVKHAASEAEQAAKKIERRHILITWGCIALMAIGIALLGCVVSAGFLVLEALVLLGAVFTLMFQEGGPFDLSSEAKKELEAACVRKLVAERQTAGSLAADLWPNLKEPAQGSTIRIELPTPPPEVQERIVAAEHTKLPLHVAVVGEAIAFKEPVADVLIGERAEHWAEVKRQELLDRDPIVYVIVGSAVAIIDQYGEFPIEKEVMHEVINSEHLV